MSKMKRKWLRVIEYEETGRPLDEVTRESLLETHPDLPILHDQAAMPGTPHPSDHLPPPTPVSLMQAPQAMMQPHGMHLQQRRLPIEPELGSQLEQQLQRDIASAEPQRV